MCSLFYDCRARAFAILLSLVAVISYVGLNGIQLLGSTSDASESQQKDHLESIKPKLSFQKEVIFFVSNLTNR